MTKEEIINKYFYKSNFFGNRCCKYNKCYPFHKWRINKKGQLQLDEGNFFKNSTWQIFYNFLTCWVKQDRMRRKEKKLKSKYENNFNNFDWEFKDNEEKYLDMDFYKN